MSRRSRTKRGRRYKLNKFRRLWIWAALSVLIAAVVGYFLLSKGPSVYPPTTIIGHVETYPRERISTTTPIPVAVQKHILEHVPVRGGERPGVIIQYNCVTFRCDPDLVPKLVAIARQYEYVYLAPYPAMDVRIALTAFARILTLDQFDQDRIVAFIEGG